MARYGTGYRDMTEEQLALFDLPESNARTHLFKSIRSENALWTRDKAKLIERYLYYFVLITRHGVYIDGFAGPQAPKEPDSWAARLVLESEPKWMRNFFLCDVNPQQIAALIQLRNDQGYLKGRTIDVFEGDFNIIVDRILASKKIKEKTATFCLLDQRTFECDWATVAKLANHKTSRKIELFYFLPTGWLARSIKGLNDPKSKMEVWWGRSEWEELQNLRSYQLVELIRDRFLNELGYAYTHAWPIYEHQRGHRVMYYMVHATDHPEAPNLMARAYRKATGRKEPPEQFEMEFNSWAQSRGIAHSFDSNAEGACASE